MQQLLLGIERTPTYTWDRFYVGPHNHTCVEWIVRWPQWSHHHSLWIYGDAGVGKTHVAHLWAEKSQGTILRFQPKEHPLEFAEKIQNFVVDDVRIFDEEWLFHFFNGVQERKVFGLWLCRWAPSHLDIMLPDLHSRLNSMMAIQIQRPSDEELSDILVHQLASYGLPISSACVRFLLSHIERSAGSIRLWVNLMSKWTAIEKCGISIPFLKRLLHMEEL